MADAARAKRNLAPGADHNRAGIDGHLNAFRRHTRQCDDDQNPAFIFEDINRRLPRKLRSAKVAQPKELPVPSLRLLQKPAGFSPHPHGQITR